MQEQTEKQPLVWLITGTSSGFGRRFINSALSRGDRVIATARSLEKLQEIKSDNLRLVQLDVTEGLESIKKKVDEAATIWGRIDVLVNNAGCGLPGILEEGGTQRLRNQFDINVFGLMDVTTAVLPHLRSQRSGTIVNIGSRSAWRPEITGLGFYAASKAAVRALSETLSVEVSPFGIRVLLVEPGSFSTEGIYGHSFDESSPIPDYEIARTTAVKRFASISGTEKGDPNKAVEAIVDVVKGEGRSKGRDMPLYLVLGEDADADVRNKCAKVLGVLEEWKDVVRGVGIDE